MLDNSKTLLSCLTLIPLTLTLYKIYQLYNTKNNEQNSRRNIGKGIESLVGNTPIFELKSLSELTGCRILAKCEFLNPGGSLKDRLALHILLTAQKNKQIVPYDGYTIYEGTVGSTGIGLAHLCLSLGYKCCIVMPSDVAVEKVQTLQNLRAKVILVKPASYADPQHFVNIARDLAQADEKGYFVDQFDTELNFEAHYFGTAKEIQHQLGNIKLDGFVDGAGTGGTIAGIGRHFKELYNDNFLIILADPQGSTLLTKVRKDVCFTHTLQEGKRKRHQIDTIVEGIGQSRNTENFIKALNYIDNATLVIDQEAVHMSRFLLKNDGIFIGSSSAVNVAATVKLARLLGPNHTLLTLLCDSGTRHTTKFWNDDFLQAEPRNLDTTTPENLEFLKEF